MKTGKTNIRRQGCTVTTKLMSCLVYHCNCEMAIYAAGAMKTLRYDIVSEWERIVAGIFSIPMWM